MKYTLSMEPGSKAQRLNDGEWEDLFECNVMRGERECVAVARASTKREARRLGAVLRDALIHDDAMQARRSRAGGSR